MNFPPEKLNVKEELYRILSHLGFSEYNHKVEFHENMFDVPNKEGAQEVLYFLFLKWDSEETMNLFRDNYPILDRKQEVNFRKACLAGLGKISLKSTFMEIPPNIQSILFTPHGKKFYRFIYHLALTVLHEIVSRAAASASEEMLLPPCKGIKPEIFRRGLKLKSIQHTRNSINNFEQTSKDLEIITVYTRKIQKISYELRAKIEDIRNQLSVCLKSMNLSESTCDAFLKDNLAVEWELKKEEIEAELSNLDQLWLSFDEILEKDDHLFSSCEVPSTKREEFCLEVTNFQNSLSQTSISILRNNGININKFKLKNDSKLDFAACISFINFGLKLLNKKCHYFPKLGDSIKEIAPKGLYEEHKKLLSYVHQQKAEMAVTVSSIKENTKKLEDELTPDEEVKSSVSLLKKNEKYTFLPPTPPFIPNKHYGFKDGSCLSFSPITGASNVPKQRHVFHASTPLAIDSSLREENSDKDLARDIEVTNLSKLYETSNCIVPVLPCNTSAYDILMTKLLNKGKIKRRSSISHHSLQIDPVSGLSLQSDGNESVLYDDESGFGTEELHADDIPEAAASLPSPSPSKKINLNPVLEKTTTDIKDILARYQKLKLTQDTSGGQPNIKTDDKSYLQTGFTKKRRSIRLDKTLLESFIVEEE